MQKARIGLFGGSFNPLHMGHINSMLTITEKMGLDKIYAIPAHQSPMKAQIVQGPTPEERLDMVKQGLSDYNSIIEVDEREVVKGGVSFTIDTIKSYSEDYSPDDIHLIIGMDQFLVFDEWKDFAELLKETNLVVTSRPGSSLPRTVTDLPKGLQPLVAAFDQGFIQLDSGRSIQFIQLQDIDISASEVRKRLRTGKNVDKYLPLKVENLIKEKGFYQPKGDRVGDHEQLTTFAAEQLFARKGIAVRGFDLTTMEAPCEYALIASGTSTKHTQTLADQVIRAIKDEYGISPIGTEGQKEGQWILLDYGSLMAHLFYDYVRAEYRLEELWQEGRDLMLTDPFLDKNTDKKDS